MANVTIQHKYSNTSGSKPSSLAEGEIAINRADKKLYISDNNNNVVEIGGGSSSGSSSDTIKTITITVTQTSSQLLSTPSTTQISYTCDTTLNQTVVNDINNGVYTVYLKTSDARVPFITIKASYGSSGAVLSSGNIQIPETPYSQQRLIYSYLQFNSTTFTIETYPAIYEKNLMQSKGESKTSTMSQYAITHSFQPLMSTTGTTDSGGNVEITIEQVVIQMDESNNLIGDTYANLFKTLRDRVLDYKPIILYVCKKYTNYADAGNKTYYNPYIANYQFVNYRGEYTIELTFGASFDTVIRFTENGRVDA